MSSSRKRPKAKPRRSKPKKWRPTVVSTFSGCGGSSLGYQMAGFDVRLAVEWGDHAVETYLANFPGATIFHGDIARLGVDEAAAMADVKEGELDVLDGSPPCQGFSVAGKRADGDERNQLFRQYARLLEGLRPKVFIMENVKGMVIGKMKPIFKECIALLRGCGYRVKARVINAKWYGVPQSRERVIFIGTREDLGVDPTHPKPTVARPVTCGEALTGIEPDELPGFDDQYARFWRRIQPGGSANNILKMGSGCTAYANAQKLHPNRPSPTIPKMNGGGGFATIAHWAEQRAVSVRELAVLSSFPLDFKWPSGKGSARGRYVERTAQIGNAVPPLFMKEIALHVREEFIGGNRKAKKTA